MLFPLFRYFILWFAWEQPISIMRAWRNVIWFGFHYFSIDHLLMTLLSPWHKYRWAYGKPFSFQRYMEVFASNMISRTLGACVRMLLIVSGIILQLVFLFMAVFTLVAWFMLPFAALLSFYYGIQIAIP